VIAVLHFSNGQVVELDRLSSRELEKTLRSPIVATDSMHIESGHKTYFLRHVYAVEWKAKPTPPIAAD